MAVLQIIFTLSAEKPHTFEECVEFSNLSVDVCTALSITGRVFANEIEALFITEGEPELVKKYYSAVIKDPKTHVDIMHSEETLNVREFFDFSVWHSLHSKGKFGPNVHDLNTDAVGNAISDNVSAKSRFLIKGLLPSF